MQTSGANSEHELPKWNGSWC